MAMIFPGFKTKENAKRKGALFLAALLVLESVFPTVSMALTSGPAQPEFGSFEPVNTTSMVDEFSGDFTYNIPVINIPGANGGGYAMSLSYHSGENVESEASWVGYGWSLNPGAIMRGKRGFADDTKNNVTYYNDVPPNWTTSLGASVGNIEVFSFGVPLSVNASIRYNNYRGFGYTAGAGLSIRQGLVSLGYSVSDGEGSFSAQVNPAALLSNKKEEALKEEYKKKYKKAENGMDQAQVLTEYRIKKDKLSKGKSTGSRMGSKASSSFLSGTGSAASSYGFHSLGDKQMPTTITPYTGLSFNANFNFQSNPVPFEIGPQFGFTGNYNRQENISLINRTGYGYLYSYDAYSDNAGVMDYYNERQGTYNKRDMYLSIPFSNADAFSVTGEGLGGGFRLHSSRAGHFRPNTAKSSMDISQVSADICVGFEFGAGANLGLGVQNLTVDGDAWGSAGSGNTSSFRFPQYSAGGEEESHFFRFNGDLGGDVNFDNSNGLSSADIQVDADFPGAKTCKPQLSTTAGYNQYLLSKIDLENTSVARSGRSSYIGYHTNAQIAGASKKPYAYEKSNDYVLNSSFATGPTVDRSKGEQIGEISTINGEGNTYVYGLPVNSGNEKNLQYDLQGVSASNIVNNFVAYKDVDAGHKSKTGQVEDGTYYTSYLLTQITSPDYVDRTMNGPTADDFGGYTKFQYEQLYKVGTTGYHFRSPYVGLNYSKGELSDKFDDMGAYSSGDKDIYYMKQIITNSHIARFFTSDRLDGIEAAADNVADASSTAKGTKTLKKLDRIELYTNDNGSPGKLIKKVIFKYDYSLCKSLPNTTGAGATSGKLTLKELWFEHDGIVSAKISPYQFEYQYPTTSTADYPTKYDNIQAEFTPFATSQNPDYSPFAIDGWGNYQDATTGALRFDSLKVSVDQTPPANFDPAAWQLKQIILPSGGQIHVQYEQDDYLYVQDRRAEALVSLKTGVSQENELLGSTHERTYVLNSSDIGVTTSTEKTELAQLIRERYNNKKIYFKFLYALMGLAPDLTKCNTDYISGYVNFLDAYVNGSGEVEIKVGNSTDSGYDIPRKICLDLVKKQKGGKLTPLGNCDADEAGVQDGLSIQDLAEQLISKIGTSFFAETTSCLEINTPLSYFKIPCLKAKKGGGIRVKRIMMFDKNGMDTNQEALYGTEYFYQQLNGSSSGVATNEPAGLRDENALITFMPQRAEQGFISKAISGTDREQFEGPIGESLLPSASVGYSRIVAKSIHSGKTNTGFVISEFNTVRDYPFDMQYSGTENGMAHTQIDQERDWMYLPAILANYSVSNVWASQGYRFIINAMHGQPKSVKTYAGDYNPSTPGTLSFFAESSSTEYEYFKPGESISVQKPDGSTATSQLGKEMEVVYEMKQVEDVTTDGSIEVDFGVGMAGIIPLPQASLSPLLNYTESRMRTHVTSKIIRYPAIQKRVKTTQDGVMHTTENLVFGAYTGSPLITKTTDGYDGLNLPSDNPHNGVYTSYLIPAYSQYPEFGQKAASERFVISGSAATAFAYQPSPAKLILSGAADCGALKAFTKGDLIKVNTYYFHVDDIVGNEILLSLTANLNTSASISSVTSIEIVRSGKNNQLNTNAGSYVTYGQSASTTALANLTAAQLAYLNSFNTAWASLASGTSASFSYETCLKNGLVPAGNVTFTKIGTEAPYTVSLTVTSGPVVCTNVPDLPYSSTGIFYVDTSTGLIKYKTSSTACLAYTLSDCLQFCSVDITPATVSKVISSSAVTFDHVWDYDANLYPSIPVLSYNNYEMGKRGKWRPLSTYVYNTSIIGGAQGTERNYKDAGTYLLEMFNWKNTALNNTSKWIKASTVTKYSASGEAQEEVDAIDIYSSAKFGYNNMVPYLVAQNSNYSFCAFESFEKIYNSNTKFEDGVAANFPQYMTSSTNPIAHSGIASYSLAAAGANDFKFNKFTCNANLAAGGLSVKVWVKDVTKSPAPVKGNFIVTSPSSTTPLNFKKVAQTGEWGLYEAKIATLTNGWEYQIQFQSNLSAGTIYIDDVRQQPLNAQVNAYVYDPSTLRLLASFDDQHFGMYYQYNQQGQLVRKMIETERGMKTVGESQYNSPTKFRTPGLY